MELQKCNTKKLVLIISGLLFSLYYRNKLLNGEKYSSTFFLLMFSIFLENVTLKIEMVIIRNIANDEGSKK